MKYWNTDVVRVLHNAIEYYTENGRLAQAARQLRVSPSLCAASQAGQNARQLRAPCKPFLLCRK